MTKNDDLREFEYSAKIVKWTKWLFGLLPHTEASPRTIKVTEKFVSIPRDGNASNDDRILFGEIDSFSVSLTPGEYTQTTMKVQDMTLSTPTGTCRIDGKRLSDADFATIREHIFDRINPELMDSVDPAFWFDLATKYETDGDWELAFRHYKRAAEQLEGQQDGVYAENCIKRLAEKMKLGEES